MRRGTTPCIAVAAALVAIVGGVVLVGHLTAASAASHPTSLAQAEARATLLVNRATVGQLDKRGVAELHGLIRRYHLVTAGSKPCKTRTKADGTTELSCVAALRFINRNVDALRAPHRQHPLRAELLWAAAALFARRRTP